MGKICFSGVIITFFCLLGARAQIQLTPTQGATILNTRNLEPHHVDVIDGVAKMSMTSPHPNFIGSPYLDEEFKEGSMKAVDGTIIPGLKYRYDIYADKMEFIVNEDTVYINLPMALEYVEIGDRKFEYEVFMLVRDQLAAGYFEILYEGDFLSALYQRRIKLEQDAYVVNYGGGGGTKDFKLTREKFLYVKPGDSAAQLIERKKDLYRVLPKYESQIKSFLKSNKLSHKRVDDFYRIVEYMDRLFKGL